MSRIPHFVMSILLSNFNWWEQVYVSVSWRMDSQIREKRHQTSKGWAFWACPLDAQTKSIYVEKNVATVLLL
jgi:hypothetical protein